MKLGLGEVSDYLIIQCVLFGRGSTVFLQAFNMGSSLLSSTEFSSVDQQLCHFPFLPYARDPHCRKWSSFRATAPSFTHQWTPLATFLLLCCRRNGDRNIQF